MNKLHLQSKVLGSDDKLSIDGIEFTNAILVNLTIDSVPIESLPYLDVALVVFSELERSLGGSGRYLILTSASGIADDGGWDGIDVIFKDTYVTWKFHVEDKIYDFEFELQQYINEIRSLEIKLTELTEKYELEPTEVFFPESWKGKKGSG